MSDAFPSLVQIAKGEAYFVEYRDYKLFYKLVYKADNGYENSITFPIPISDAGEGSFVQVMKGIQVQRWARKFVDDIRDAINQAKMP